MASSRSLGRRTIGLAALTAVQGACAVFFVVDAGGDFFTEGVSAISVLEAAVALTLCLSTVLSLRELAYARAAAARASRALALAKGAFAEVVEARFADWALSPAEADVAMFLLKGMDAGEIAVLRGSAEGTVRAQLAAVYRKSGVSSRTQFAAIFLDELMETGADD